MAEASPGWSRARVCDAVRLYLVTDRALCGGRALLDVVAAAVAGGVTCVQLREKEVPTREFVMLARALALILRPAGVPLIINDRLDVALVVGAQGLHLGQSDLDVFDARRHLPPGALLGLSVESLDDVRASRGLPVDYLGVRPVFGTPTKTDTAAPFGLEGLRSARALSDLPLVAIGGLNETNAAPVRRAGADGVAVVSALMAAPDAKAAARVLRRWVDDPGPAPPPLAP